jgi:AcrR family transcriptional regulator
MEPPLLQAYFTEESSAYTEPAMIEPSSQPQQPTSGGPAGGGAVQRDRVVGAFMALLAEKRFEDIGLAEIARRADVPLSDVRAKYASKIEMLAAHMREVDRAVLDGIDPGMADEPPRERLFDVLMRRLDLLAPDKAAVRSLQRSVMFNPGLTLALNGLAMRSMQWMLTAADISASGTKGMMRAQGLALLFASALRTWVDDDDPGQARTLAALDRAMSSGQRWAGFLDDLFRIPEAACRARRAFSRRRPHEDRSRESAAA